MSKLDLTGTWSLTEKGKKRKIPVQVPGDLHSALLKSEKIPDPYFA